MQSSNDPAIECPDLIPSALLLLWSFLVIVEGISIEQLVEQNDIKNAFSSTSSPWLKEVTNWDPRLRPPGCWNRPWICRQGEALGTQMRCCRNRCVDVSYDINNCGLCGIRCRFSCQCCRGFCTNTDSSRFNCGRCGNRCPRGVRCVYGMCGYAQPWPPRPPYPSRPPKGDQPPLIMG